MAVVDYEIRFRDHEKAIRLSREKPEVHLALSRRGRKAFATSAENIPTGVCIKCGSEPSQSYNQTLTAENWLLGLLFMLIPIPIPMPKAKSVEVEFGLCDRCIESGKQRRIGLILASLAMPFIGVVVAVNSLLWGSLILLAWPVVVVASMFLKNPIGGRPVEDGILISGIEPKFLERLPQARDQS